MGSNPSFFSGVNLPVESVSWTDLPPFIEELNKKTGGRAGKQYRLPSEAEWEFAAKGGTKSLGYTIAGAPDDRVDDVMWHRFNSNNQTNPVGQKQPNELGIYDMTGNVWEWVNDWYSGYSKEPVFDPVGPSIGEYRIYRGFGFKNGRTVRITRRVYAAPEISFNDVGFRVVISN
jgi:formylglycine-generating enzyme required for sulfatase activity